MQMIGPRAEIIVSVNAGARLFAVKWQQPTTRARGVRVKLCDPTVRCLSCQTMRSLKFNSQAMLFTCVAPTVSTGGVLSIIEHQNNQTADDYNRLTKPVEFHEATARD